LSFNILSSCVSRCSITAFLLRLNLKPVLLGERVTNGLQAALFSSDYRVVVKGLLQLFLKNCLRKLSDRCIGKHVVL